MVKIFFNIAKIGRTKLLDRTLYDDDLTGKQGCGSVSGSGLDPDSIESVDPDPVPDSESGSGSSRAKRTHKSRIFF
jgi:hypothetical protein